MFQCRTLTHDFFEVKFGADLVFQVELFFGQFVGKLGDLTVGAGVIQGDGDLSRHLF